MSLEKTPCSQQGCTSRLSSKYKDGRDLCRTHMVEIMEIDDWIDRWLSKYKPSK